jgi:hypothetical protein
MRGESLQPPVNARGALLFLDSVGDQTFRTTPTTTPSTFAFFT